MADVCRGGGATGKGTERDALQSTVEDVPTADSTGQSTSPSDISHLYTVKLPYNGLQGNFQNPSIIEKDSYVSFNL